MKPIQLLINGYGQVTFWLWNLLFVLTVYFGILPFVGLPILQATVAGQISWTFTVSLLIVLGVPLICLGVGVRLVRRPLALLRLFYGVEAPMVILALVRLVALRELTPASQLILGTIGISILSFAVYLTRGLWPGRWGAVVQLVLHTLMLLTGVYAGAVLLFFALPVAMWFLQGLVTLAWVRPLWEVLNPAHWSWALWYTPMGLVLFGLTVSVFVVTPSSWASLYVLAGWDALKRVSQQYGRRWAIATAVGTLTTWLVLFLAVLPQPQGHAFALLQTPPANPAAQRALLAQSAAIRKGLLNAYLHDYRYFSTRHESNSLRSLYANYLPKAETEWVQARFNDLLSPFLYQGEADDGDRAAQLYADFFDQPIQKAEQRPISHALNSTGYRDEAKAGLLNLNQRRVLLANQNVTVTENGDWATVELHEVYQNQTNDVQEVFYSFSLPESAVMTGVWLGDTADLARRFNFQVSPRGAAQQVYNAQVQRANPIDPALLEQVGPRHYRLRAFPVPPQIPAWATRNPRAVNAPAPTPAPASPPAPTEMHLWLTYQVMRTEQGWPLPQLGETRNLFWSAKTQRSLAGQPVPQALRWDDQWLPTRLPAQTQAPAQSHSVTLADQRVVARPLTAEDYRLPQGQRFAIVLDTSRSMGVHGKAWRSQLHWLQQHGFTDHQLNNNDADLFLTSATTSPSRLDDLRQFNPNQTVFYGKLQLNTMLEQVQQLQGETVYNGIILVTDGDTYELSEDESAATTPGAPLWLVHLGKLPPAYDDKVLEAIQDSGGGVTTDIAEALQRGATQADLGNGVTVMDGYAWSVQPRTLNPVEASPVSEANPVSAVEPGFTPLVARQVVVALGRQFKGTDPTVAQLDSIHAIAKQFKIVTPYSSMIVLVNDEQRRQLAEAELKSDRFNREVENGNEALEKPDNLLSTSVPEASPLLGMGLVGLLLWSWRRWPMGSTSR